MAKKKFNEEKIINVLQEAEGDITFGDVCRKHQITDQTFYHWRINFSNMTVLENDNTQLRQIVADLTLDNRILRDSNQNKW